MGSYRYRSLIEGLYITYRSLVEALYTLNSPPLASFNLAIRALGVEWSWTAVSNLRPKISEGCSGLRF